MQIDGDTPKFLLNHASLRWVNVNDAAALNASKPVMLTEGTTGMLLGIGRINLTTKAAGSFTTVGMVVKAASGRKLWFMAGVSFSDSSIVQVTTGYEMLSC